MTGKMDKGEAEDFLGLSAAKYHMGYSQDDLRRARTEQMRSVHPDTANSGVNSCADESIAAKANAAHDFLKSLFGDDPEERIIPETYREDSAEDEPENTGERGGAGPEDDSGPASREDEDADERGGAKPEDGDGTTSREYEGASATDFKWDGWDVETNWDVGTDAGDNPEATDQSEETPTSTEGNPETANQSEEAPVSTEEKRPRFRRAKFILALVVVIFVALRVGSCALYIGSNVVGYFKQEKITAETMPTLPGSYQQHSFLSPSGLCLTSLTITSADAATGRISFDYVTNEATISGANGASFSGTVNCAPKGNSGGFDKELKVSGEGTSSAYEGAVAKFEGTVVINGGIPSISGDLTVDTTFHGVATQEKTSVSASKVQ